jgi:tetratricopeptide (TPR) repeat protein
VPNLNNLGALDLRMGNLIDAERAYLEALRVAEAKLPPMALERLAAEINYSVVLWHSGRTNLAEPRLRDLLSRMEQSVGAAHPASGRVRSILGRVILERGDADTARRFIENSLEGLTPYWRSDALLWLAETKLETEQPNIAAELARESLTLRQSIPHYTNWQIAEAEFVLAKATGDAALLNAVADRFKKQLPAGHFRRGD